MRKGIILAGGRATRLWPVTKHITKQLLPVYDKPMIYYPLTTAIEAGIRDILVICDPNEAVNFSALLGDGSSFGVHIKYAFQERARGIAEALVIADDEGFVSDGDRIMLILGDNLYHGGDLRNLLTTAIENEDHSQIFLCKVLDPCRYGVAAFNGPKLSLSRIVEKPKEAPSEWAVSGLYIYNYDCVDIARNLKPSGRQELEITDVNNAYIDRGEMTANFLDGTAWLDMGTPGSLFEAGQYVRTIQHRTGRQVGCPEEAAYNNNWLAAADLKKINQPNSGYANYLRRLAEEQVSWI